MSSFYLTGFFELTSGRRSPTVGTRADGSPSRLWHLFYDVELLCSEGASPPFHAELRKYCEVGEVALAEHSVAFVAAKCYIPTGEGAGVVQLDAAHIIPIPGDSSAPEYSEHLPNFWFPMVFLLGVIAPSKPGRAIGETSFLLNVSEFVRGAQKQSVVQCVLDTASPHWRNFPPPCHGSTVYVIGLTLDHVFAGHLSVAVENVVYCTAAAGNPNAASGPTPSGDGKRRRFGPSTFRRPKSGGSSEEARSSSSGAGPSTGSPMLTALNGMQHVAVNGSSGPAVITADGVMEPHVASSSNASTRHGDGDLGERDDAVPSTRSKGKRKAVN